MSKIKNPKFRYLIARNKITRMFDVIDARACEVVSSGHASRDVAEAAAAKLLFGVSASAVSDDR